MASGVNGHSGLGVSNCVVVNALGHEHATSLCLPLVDGHARAIHQCVKTALMIRIAMVDEIILYYIILSSLTGF